MRSFVLYCTRRRKRVSADMAERETDAVDLVIISIPDTGVAAATEEFMESAGHRPFRWRTIWYVLVVTRRAQFDNP